MSREINSPIIMFDDLIRVIVDVILLLGILLALLAGRWLKRHPLKLHSKNSARHRRLYGRSQD